MSVLSVKLSPKLEHMMQNMISDGIASNKAALVRKAIERLAEAEAVNVVLRAEKELDVELKTMLQSVKNGKLRPFDSVDKLLEDLQND